jgi:hypothetical protein
MIGVRYWESGQSRDGPFFDDRSVLGHDTGTSPNHAPTNESEADDLSVQDP